MENDLPDMQLVRSSGGLIRGLESVLDALCALLLVLMTCITTIDVVGRYIFHSPLHGAYESNELFLGIFIFRYPFQAFSCPLLSGRDKPYKLGRKQNLINILSCIIKDCHIFCKFGKN